MDTIYIVTLSNILMLLSFLLALGALVLGGLLAYWLEGKSKNKFIKLLGPLIGILGILAGLVVIVFATHQRELEERQEAAAKDAQKLLWAEYNGRGYFKTESNCNKDGSLKPYIKGKVLVIDEKSMELDGVHFQLPNELRPANQDDVGTIVLLKWDLDLVGRYGSGGYAFASTCSVHVCDQVERCLVARTKFSNPPPEKITLYGSSPGPVGATGEKPVSEVLDYIEKLPRQ